jgi:hypothetical protein
MLKYNILKQIIIHNHFVLMHDFFWIILKRSGAQFTLHFS